jgi:hypothetical protein
MMQNQQKKISEEKEIKSVLNTLWLLILVLEHISAGQYSGVGEGG